MAIDTSIGSILTTPKSQLRNLPKTQQEWYPDNDGLHQIYNTPLQTGKELDANQGKDPSHRGTCGIVSCVNILRLAGRLDATESEVLMDAIAQGLCTTNDKLPASSGGTTCVRRQQILKRFGLESELIHPSTDAIAEYVSAGKGVIISVFADRLWKDPRYHNAYHAVVVTSVVKNASGNVTGFYICDSGRRTNDCAHFYTVEELKYALTPRKMNVTTSIIR